MVLSRLPTFYMEIFLYINIVFLSPLFFPLASLCVFHVSKNVTKKTGPMNNNKDEEEIPWPHIAHKHPAKIKGRVSTLHSSQSGTCQQLDRDHWGKKKRGRSGTVGKTDVLVTPPVPWHLLLLIPGLERTLYTRVTNSFVTMTNNYSLLLLYLF